ncbi:MAG: hypothetical protein SFU85_07815 [Candidatus Methylacidiphilales bacterium]|nr:hypothetical protein [Candidatus Methylacidiphilales bacterium]
MTLSLPDFFVVYVLVFLAAILGAWLIVLWNAQRQFRRDRPTFPCRICAQPVPFEGQMRHTRCPSCGVRNTIPESFLP